MADFHFQPMFEHSGQETEFRKLTSEHVSMTELEGQAILKIAPEALFIFMLPGSYDELRQRLSRRMSESSPDMELRLQTAASEVTQVSQFDYRVVNHDDSLAEVVAEIDAIITAEKCRVVPRSVNLL